ncbi:MAG: hypothetical protein K8H87_02190 [Pseudorhodoplanes sp.]|nr:hypothetical protein [Pseudorhodoplanes sp.]
MSDRLDVHQLCAAAGITRTQFNAWVARGYFDPEEPPVNGKRRSFSFREAIALGTFAELVRLGIPHEIAAQHCKNLHAFKDEAALLVLHQGPVELIASSERGSPLPGAKSGVKFYDPDRPSFDSDIIRLSQLAAYAANRDMHSLAVVNLDHVESRAKSALQSAPEAVVTPTDGSLTDGSTKRRRKR